MSFQSFETESDTTLDALHSTRVEYEMSSVIAVKMRSLRGFVTLFETLRFERLLACHQG